MAKKTKNLCSCGRKIVYFTRKDKRKAKFDKDHTLCMRCYRAHRDRVRTRNNDNKRKE